MSLCPGYRPVDVRPVAVNVLIALTILMGIAFFSPDPISPIKKPQPNSRGFEHACDGQHFLIGSDQTKTASLLLLLRMPLIASA